MEPRRPILLSSSARATSAEETSYRIDGPEPSPRTSRVIALDRGASEVVGRLADHPWQGAHLLVHRSGAPVVFADGELPDVRLHPTSGGDPRLLSDELAGADMVVMVATSDDGAQAAAAIGEACYRRGIMTGGVILGPDAEVRSAVSALRPHAQVLLVTEDEDDVAAVLSALRA